MQLNCLNMIRRYELDRVTRFLDPDRDLSILEIGAGMGYQAKELQKKGFKIRAIDVESSNYREDQVFPVEEYDGFHIPYADDQFDVIFSSNVLEHIAHIDSFLTTEVSRVLKKNGVAIHVVPSATWRFWSSITHYADLPARIARFISKVGSKSGRAEPSKRLAGDVRGSIAEKLLSYLIPFRHGERGNTISEFYHFSRFGWDNLFDRAGWHIVERIPSRIFYTGAGICGTALTLSVRCKLACVFGSSTHIYILKKCAE